MSGLRRDARLDLLAGGAVFALALAVYLRTLAPTVLTGDSAELQLAPYILGIAHPTGYPLYLLLGWAWSHLVQVGDVAHRMNLFSALWAALAVGLFAPTARLAMERAIGPARGPEWAGAAFMALALAFSPTFWSQAVAAEVYSLNSFLVVLALFLLLGWARDGRRGWLLGLALAFGLGLAHHRSILLLAPGMLAFLAIAGRDAPPGLRVALAGLALLLLPLALYLYIPWRAPHTPYLAVELVPGQTLRLYQGGLGGFLDFVLGRTFQGALDPSGLTLGRAATAWGLLAGQFTPAGIGLWALGLGALALRRRWAMLALTGLSFGALLLFVLIYQIGDIQDLFTPLYIILALWMAVGTGAIMAATRRAPAGWRRVASWAAVAAAAALAAWLAVTGFGQADRSGRWEVREGWEAVLARQLPEGAILVSNDRDEIMPLWYLQQVEGARPDLIGLFPLLTPEPQHANVVRLIEGALTSGRPVYLIKPMPGLEVKYRLEEELGLVRVLGRQKVSGAGWRPAGWSLGGAVELTGYRLKRRDGALEVTLRWRALRELDRDYTSYVHLVSESSETVAQSDHLPGGRYYPSSMWRPGEELADTHILSLPPASTEGALLEAGMYLQPGLEPLGERARLGDVGLD